MVTAQRVPEYDGDGGVVCTSADKEALEGNDRPGCVGKTFFLRHY